MGGESKEEGEEGRRARDDYGLLQSLTVGRTDNVRLRQA